MDGLIWAKKIVDDVLIWAPDLLTFRQRIDISADICARLNIILSQKKFVIGTSMLFAGYVVTLQGIRPDPDRVAAIRNFPTPKDLTALRSFLGMAQQLAFFIPDYYHASAAMRSLLGKGKVFQWTSDQEFEFWTLKNMLAMNLKTNHFDTSRPVFMLTDASRHFGHNLPPIAVQLKLLKRYLCRIE